MARPTKLTRDLVDKAKGYIDVMARQELPSNVGLAIYLDVAESSLYLWRDVKTPLGKEFSETLERVQTFQHYQALNKGLKGEFTAPIVKLVLANHGYADTSKIDHTSAGERLANPLDGLTTKELRKLAKGK